MPRTADEIETKKTFLGKMHIAVPPIAVVELDPDNAACRVPYAPSGNSTATYEARVSVCQDLPTGVFGVNVLHGIAGGEPEPADPSVSDNGLSIVGGGYSGQAWTLPNQLSDKDQVGEENVLESPRGRITSSWCTIPIRICRMTAPPRSTRRSS